MCDFDLVLTDGTSEYMNKSDRESESLQARNDQDRVLVCSWS